MVIVSASTSNSMARAHNVEKDGVSLGHGLQTVDQSPSTGDKLTHAYGLERCM